MSLLSGACLPVGFVISCLGVSLPVGKTFLPDSWGFELVVGLGLGWLGLG